MVKLVITPKFCLQDEKVCIKASGLTPFRPYTLTAHYEDTRSKRFFSYAHYIANSSGLIDVSVHESIGGHYAGVFQMGLIAALQPAPGQYKYLRIFKRDVEKPNKIEVRLYEGHKSADKFSSSLRVHAPVRTDFHYRYFMGPGVTRWPIREGNVRGTLFVPAGKGPFPAVIDMFGSAGGLLEYRAAQLATRGIMALALAFFDYEDLPKYAGRFHLKYFEEAVHVLLNHEKVLRPHVGVVGVSKGGDIALTMAAFIPQVSVAVSINGCCSVLAAPVKINEEYTIPALETDLNKAKFIDEEIVINNKCCNDPEEFLETIIPIQKCNSKFLFIVGEDDLNLDSKKYALLDGKLMDESGKRDNYEIRVYKGAGHLIEPPYSSFCPASYHKVIDLVLAWGGALKPHTEAQEAAWAHMLAFIKNNLKQKNSKL